MHVRIDLTLPRLPRRRVWRIGLAAIMTLVVAVPGIALASHQFGDVSTSHPFHGDISAIADANVTSGCGGGNYCPDRNVTRAEMAAFMNRLGALASNKTPVVNADKVDGVDAGDLQLEAVSGGGTDLPTSLTPQAMLAPETITTTRTGRWLATKTARLEVLCTSGNRYYYLMLDGVPIRTSILVKWPTDPIFSGQLSGLTDYPFAAGPHSLSLAGQCATTGNFGGSVSSTASSSSVIVLPPSAETGG